MNGDYMLDAEHRLKEAEILQDKTAERNISSRSLESKKDKLVPDKNRRYCNNTVFSSTPNHANSSKFSNNNCYQVDCSWPNEIHPRQTLDSVSSDPELYTRSPSATKLNVQIQKLKDDMLALRSTTASYKRYMDKIFDELKAIAIMHDSTLPKWYAEDFESFTRASFPAVLNSETFLKDCKVIKSKTGWNDEEGLLKSIFIPSKKQDSVVADKNIASGQVRQSTNHGKDHAEHETIQNSSTRKLNERPCSDPFASCSVESTTAKYSIKSADSSLENESKRLKAKLDRGKVFSILTESNISESSIDSGFQESSATSPRDQLNREIGPVVVSPLLPNELIAEVASSPESYCGQRSRLIKTKQSPNTAGVPSDALSCSLMETQNKQIKTFDEVKKKENYESNSNGTCIHALMPSAIEKTQNKIQSENPAIRLISKQCIDPPSRVRAESNVSDKSDRPIPKQRTVFSSSVKQLTVANKNTTALHAEKNEMVDSQGENSPFAKDVSSNASVKSADSRTTNDSKNLVTQSLDDEQTPIKKFERPNCLAIHQLKPSSTTDLGSPSQRRVKLGVSAIKQLTPNADKKDGALFYCVGQMSRKSDVNSRARKNVNAKQLLREKYAAAIERSSRAAAKKEAEATTNESDWSMVRRRSMRMMTEFQIFDFKDNAIDDKASSNTSVKTVEKGTANVVLNADTNVKQDNIDVPVFKKYSVSPSAAIVSKQIFEAESPSSNSSRQYKPSPQNFHDSKKESSEPPHYAGYPLPPPPPPPPKSPQNKNEESFSKQPTCASESSNNSKVCQIPAELTENPVFISPLIRPKPFLPLEAQSEVRPSQPCYNGLKLSPNSKSAFTPVSSIAASPAEETKPFNGSLKSEISLDVDIIEAENSTKTEEKRRLSLPQALLSNKQRFLNEFMPNASISTNQEATSDWPRRASLLTSRRKPEPIDSVISTETSTVTGYKVPDNPAVQDDKISSFATTEPLFCKIPQDANPCAVRDAKHRRHVSGDKTKTSSTTSTNQHTSLENQPFRYNRSENISDVVGALRTGGYLPSNELHRASNKASRPNLNLPNSNKKPSREDKNNAAPAQFRGRHHLFINQGQMQTCYKAHSSSSLHQYETVKLAESKKSDNKQKNKRFMNKDIPPNDANRQSTARSHKSTIALIRDSLLGKRDKTPRRFTADGKRHQAVNGEKIRSSSVGDKMKINETSFFESKFSKGKKKESKSKKEKISAKELKKDIAINKKLAKNNCSSQAGTPGDETFPFPDPSCSGYGQPDSEVMERFLAAAAAAASDTPRSPLQRLRSSFRTPKNKNKFLQESRIKDDMGVATGSCSNEYVTRKNTNIHNGQEFTYV